MRRLWPTLEVYVYAALRIIAGGMFLCHGLQKLFGLLGGELQPVGSQLWVGGIVELVGGTLIALGLFARPAAFLTAGQMAVAYIQFHWKFQFDKNFFPIVTGSDDTVLYCFVFLLVLVRGAGPVSLDRVLKLPGGTPAGSDPATR